MSSSTTVYQLFHCKPGCLHWWVLTALAADSCHQQHQIGKCCTSHIKATAGPREEEAPQLHHSAAASPFLPLTASSISWEHTKLTSHQTLRSPLCTISDHSYLARASSAATLPCLSPSSTGALATRARPSAGLISKLYQHKYQLS